MDNVRSSSDLDLGLLEAALLDLVGFDLLLYASSGIRANTRAVVK